MVKKKKKTEHPHWGHRNRMREKFLKGGLGSFQDHEVLELLLYYSVKQGNINPFAHRLIREFGTLTALLEASPEVISKKCKIELNTAILISLILPIYKRYETAKWGKKFQINTSEEACEFAKGLFIGETVEVFYIICMDSKNNVIYPAEIARGTIDEISVYTRVIVEKAIQYNAATIILVHNHTAGTLTPSMNDINTTRSLRVLMGKIGINLADHIIVGGTKAASMVLTKLLHTE